MPDSPNGNGEGSGEVLSSRQIMSGIRLPPFIADDPELWFSLVDKYFINIGVKDEVAKFNHTVTMLDPRYSREVRDLIINAPTVEAYENLKRELVKRLSTSQEQKTRRVLESEEIGDRKPSQFLRHLRGLAGKDVSKAMMRTLWFGRLSNNMQMSLVAHKDLPLEKLTDLADTIGEYINRPRTISETSSQVGEADLVKQMNKMVLSLQQDLTEVRREVASLRGEPLRNRSRSRSRSVSRNRNANGFCWYHFRFGEKAKKCNKSCNYSPGNDVGGR